MSIPSTSKKWMEVIPESERATYTLAGFHQAIDFGKRIVLLIVDATYGFTGSEGVTLEEAIQEFPTACGPAAWEALPRIATLLQLFRESHLPIVFTRGAAYDSKFVGGAVKSQRQLDMAGRYNEFPTEIRPSDGEYVLEKTKASAFFETPLQSYLVRQGVDTVVVCGVSTSGCVRASAVDAHSHGYATFVIEDCCFDRSYFAHCANLFDLNAKYAHVLSLEEIQHHLGRGGISNEYSFTRP
ncbi:cysteine hydrolase family protein [Alicyclobacillus fastidiosus]|uniref:Isochorismatase family protein n=1 Tax=Alicyclobacillus fastidiosus TaxID=392011 RepID=A0ABV5AGE2_9BACL|nr:isochorismatase family protein [Alicyclobacillus fastidiosus]WEH08959.1 isochorismatase family protein [Alicyclobacillus fastidiosus]